MSHARRHEQPRKLSGLLATQLALDIFVIVERARGRDDRITPAVIQQQLSARVMEPGQVGVGRVEDVGHEPRPRRVSVEIEGRPVEVRIVDSKGKVTEELILKDVVDGRTVRGVEEPTVPLDTLSSDREPREE